MLVKMVDFIEDGAQAKIFVNVAAIRLLRPLTSETTVIEFGPGHIVNVMGVVDEVEKRLRS